MAKYLIRACINRLWYVQNYLIPSMIKQGIDESDIQLYFDESELGCLESCMQAFTLSKEDMWYLQDDIIICHDFKERTEQYDSGIVNGYCYVLDDRTRYIGKVKPVQYWYSFPCIRIPRQIANDCAKWFYEVAKNNLEYRMWIRAKKYDDSIFSVFMQDYYTDYEGINLSPNLVDHIDYLIGGSVINKIRPEKETHAAYFTDRYLIDELESMLKK